MKMIATSQETMNRHCVAGSNAIGLSPTIIATTAKIMDADTTKQVPSTSSLAGAMLDRLQNVPP
jgi:hypothetical protein